jgi:hypothetical protein
MRRCAARAANSDTAAIYLQNNIWGSPKTCVEKLERKAAAVSFTKGKGKIVMFGFRVQHRAQTEGTFQLLFNAIYWGGLQQ